MNSTINWLLSFWLSKEQMAARNEKRDLDKMVREIEERAAKWRKGFRS